MATPTFTIATIANYDVEGHAEAILRTATRMPYHCETLLLTPFRCTRMGTVHIDHFGTDYHMRRFKLCRFILKDLPRYITTDYMIFVQADGFAVNRDAWTDEFLEYDYIGAPLPLWATLCMRGNRLRRVGTGGFSLRSKKLMDFCTELLFDGSIGEDALIYRHNHRLLERQGCRFAPIHLAYKWCAEYRLEDRPWYDPNKSFGRHGQTETGMPFHQLSPARAFLRVLKQSLRNGLRSV